MARAAALLLAGLAGITLAAQPPEQVIKREIDAVQIDARVLDRDGHFVRGLTKDDLSLLEDGREQSITTFDLIDLPIADPHPPSTPIVDPDVAANGADGGRSYLIVLDDLHTHPLRSITVRELAREFIERNMGPGDRAAIIATSARQELATEFTSNRGRLIASVNKFEGGFSAGARCGSDDGPCRADEHLTLRYLTRLATWLSGLDGRRKALLFISEGFDGAIPDLFTPSTPRSTIFDSLSNVNEGAADLRETITAAARSNVSIFAVDPRGLPGAPSTTVKPVTTLADDDESRAIVQRQSLEILSEETGGFALVHSNAFSDAFARVVSESSSYYLLGYTSTNTARDGKFRRVQVRAKRPGLTVRARSGYLALNDKAPSRPATAGNLATPLVAAMQSPVPLSGIRMAMTAAPFRGVKGRASVAVVMEAQSRNLPLSLFIAASDLDGNIKAEEHGTLDIKPGAMRSEAEQRMRLVSRLTLQPGRYQLRVAAVDTAGATGSVHFDLDVPDFSKGAIAMGGVMLASSGAAGAPTSGTDRSWRDQLPDPPTTARIFVAADRLSLFTEVYGNGGKTGDRIEIATTVRRDSGENVLTRSELLPPSAGRQPESRAYRTTIPLTALSPGGYVLRIDARRTTDAKAVASREIPFTIR